MATSRGKGGKAFISVTLDQADYRALTSTLSKLSREAQDEMRAEALTISRALARDLEARAKRAPTPVAARVAESITPKRDRMVNVEVGGSKRVGRPYRSRRRTASGRVSTRTVRAPAGALLWGSETGSDSGTDRDGRAYTDRFAAPRNPAGYWLTPGAREGAEAALDAWLRVLLRIAAREGLTVEGVPHGRA